MYKASALDRPNSTRPRVVHRRSLSNPIVRFSEPRSTTQSVAHLTPHCQRLDLPPTPELAANSLVDTPTSLNHEPPTPLYPEMPVPHSAAFEQAKTRDTLASSVLIEGVPDRARRDHSRHQTIDTRAIFVGGLESAGPHAWSEEKLRYVFGKYGSVLEARLMIPGQ